MKALQRFFGVVSNDRIDSTLAIMVAEMENDRNDTRKKALLEVDKCDVTKEGDRVAAILLQMNRDLTSLYEKETILREFINKLK
jgi:hypothetical protein